MSGEVVRSSGNESELYEAALRSKVARQGSIKRILNYWKACDERAKLKIKQEENSNAENSTRTDHDAT